MTTETRACIYLEMNGHRISNSLTAGDHEEQCFEPGNEKSESQPHWSYLFALTCPVGGLQVIWSVTFSNGASFLTSLGLTPSFTALIWAFAPLSGIIFQPIAAALSDRSGRRRPFLIFGSLAVVVCLLALAWVESLMYILTRYLRLESMQIDEQLVVGLAAMVLVVALNVSIQPVQMSARAMVVESVDRRWQSRVSAWASYMTGVGNIVGYVCGVVGTEKVLDLPNLKHFQMLSLVASGALMTAVFINCSMIRRELCVRHAGYAPVEGRGSSVFARLASIPRELFDCFNTVPQNVRKVCQIQFWAWMGWFPFLYYSTSYVGELYPASHTLEDSSPIQSKVSDQSIRSATVANLAFAVVALLTNIGLYFRLRIRKQYGIIIDTPHSDQKTVPRFILRIVHAWTYAHIFFVVSMLATFFQSWISRAILVASVGISWSLTLWGPFAIIGYEIAASESELSTGEKPQAGMIMSLNNIAISAPQLVAAIISSGIFRFTQWMGSVDGMGWALRGGSCAAMVAAYYTSRFEKR